MHEVQAAFMGSGSGGAGSLSFRGGQYAFEVGGIGVGGIGLSTIEATGEVYNRRDLGQFPGTYGQARYGFAIGTASGGDLWLQNEAGVIMHLKAKRTGLMLSLGGGRRRRHLDAPVSAPQVVGWQRSLARCALPEPAVSVAAWCFKTSSAKAAIVRWSGGCPRACPHCRHAAGAWVPW
jgi:hypothetical protein